MMNDGDRFSAWFQSSYVTLIKSELGASMGLKTFSIDRKVLFVR